MKDIEIENVDIFSPFSNVNGWFTKKNGDVIGRGRYIEGLNCGYNTEATPSEVMENRVIVFNKLGLKSENVAFAKQVHGSQIGVVSSGGTYPDTDALITETFGLTLAIQVADCAAVLLADPDTNIIAAVHAGWRGAVANIIPKTIKKMGKLATARPDRMLVYISPCISQHYFEVGEEVSDRFPREFVDTESFVKDHVDLKGFIIKQLKDAGISEKQISADSGCTYRETHAYYSYRREGDKAGRMLALIQLQ